MGKPGAMIERSPTSGCSPSPRLVVVVVSEDETIQAMWCVALELLGFQPIAANDDREAIDLAAVLPTSPLAILTTAGESSNAGPEDRPAGRFRSRRGSVPPTLVLERPSRTGGEPAGMRQVPEFTEALEALQALAVG